MEPNSPTEPKKDPNATPARGTPISPEAQKSVSLGDQLVSAYMEKAIEEGQPTSKIIAIDIANKALSDAIINGHIMRITNGGEKKLRGSVAKQILKDGTLRCGDRETYVLADPRKEPFFRLRYLLGKVIDQYDLGNLNNKQAYDNLSTWVEAFKAIGRPDLIPQYTENRTDISSLINLLIKMPNANLRSEMSEVKKAFNRVAIVDLAVNSTDAGQRTLVSNTIDEGYDSVRNTVLKSNLGPTTPANNPIGGPDNSNSKT